MDKKRTVKLAALVFDLKLYPRRIVDDLNVRDLVDAIRTGVILPPPIIDAARDRVVDGRHRCIAHGKVHGSDATITVIARSYPDEASILEDAIRLNSQHGRRLDPADRAHCAILAEEVGLSIERVAEALHLTRVRYDVLIRGKVGHLVNGMKVPRKNTLRGLGDIPLTPNLAKANDKASGMSPMFYVNQVINLLENDAIDQTNTKLMERLIHLARLIEQKIAVPA